MPQLYWTKTQKKARCTERPHRPCSEHVTQRVSLRGRFLFQRRRPTLTLAGQRPQCEELACQSRMLSPAKWAASTEKVIVG